MATIYDLIEVTSISANTTYSDLNGNILGVVDGMTSVDLDDGEFDVGDSVTIGGVTYSVSVIREPDSQGWFETRGGVLEYFNAGSESNLNVMFLTLTNGSETRHFILPNDSYGDMEIISIHTGNLTTVAGSDAAVIGTTDNAVSIICFVAGTRIEGAGGAQHLVEHLRPGMPIRTADHGLQPLRWLGGCHLGRARLRACPHLAPIHIAPGALGAGLPRADLLVSPQHRILIRSRIAGRMFGCEEVLVAAKRLLPLPGISVASDLPEVCYHHLLFDRHEVIFANGAAAESLLPGPEAMKALEPAARAEVLALLPGFALNDHVATPGRTIAQGRQGKSLIARHLKNGKPPLGGPPDPSSG